MHVKNAAAREFYRHLLLLTDIRLSLHDGSDAAALLRQLREDARY
ncbi:MAG: hypothetical protein ACRC1L_08440 [Prochlorococcaceae cyanobacterium]